MRSFIRRFGHALRTIPGRVRWILSAPVAFIALFLVDGRLAISVFFAVLLGLVVREFRQHPSQRVVLNSSNPSGITTGLVATTTGLPIDKQFLGNIGGYYYGEDVVTSDHWSH